MSRTYDFYFLQLGIVCMFVSVRVINVMYMCHVHVLMLYSVIHTLTLTLNTERRYTHQYTHTAHPNASLLFLDPLFLNRPG